MTKKVDIVLKLEEVSSNGTRATRETRLVQIDTKSTTLGRLKDMARFQLNIRGDLELWLVHDDGARPMNLRHTDPISKFITKDSTIQVEKLDVRNHHDYPSSAFATCNAFPPTPQSLAFAGKENQRGDEEIARLLSLQLNDPRENRAMGMRYASPPIPPSIAVAGKEIERGDEEIARSLSLQINDSRENRSKGMLYASSPTPASVAFDRKECERGDEEMARLLSLQLNGMHVNPPKQMLLPRPLGDIIARASFSQFAIEGGRSACTSICLYAAAQLLNGIAEAPSCITTSVLDGYLQVGTMIYTDLYLQHGDHTSLDDLWNHPIYSDIVRPLQRRTVIHGTTSRRSFQECLGEARTYAHCHDEKSVAVVLTKPPETILLICKDVHQGAPWFLFDSHGHQYENPKKAFVVQFGSLETAAAALLEKFPNIEGLGDTLHAQQMNMFEAHAIVRKPRVILKEFRFSTSSMDGYASMKVGQQLHLQDSINEKVLDDPACRGKGRTHETLSRAHDHSRDSSDKKPFADAVFSDTRRPHAKLPDSQAHIRDSCTDEGFADAVEEPFADATEVAFVDAVFCDKGYPHEGLPDLREHYQDPTTGELLADPVICDRGHTHERSSIERHFAARREMKADEEERLRQKQGSPLTAEETCNAQRNFDPTCPLTGEAISEILIDNDQCDRMVQLLVESGQIPLEDGELEDWRERRKEKARLAKERRAQVAAKSALQSTQESSQHESEDPPSVVSINSNTVMIKSQSFNRAGHFHLGVAVALCPSDWERPVREQVSIPRCFNSCCRTRLHASSQGACARCTQILCSDCLVFHVKEATPRASDAVDDDHAICPECVAQILHAVGARSATESGTDESRLMEKIDDALKQFFASLMEQKAELQHQVLQYRIHQSYATDDEALSQRIEELLQERATLENQIRLAQEQANAAKTDRDECASETTLPAAGKASITSQIRQAQEQASATKTDRDESAFQKELPAPDSPTANELRLQIRISEIRTELDEIEWTTEEGMIRGSLLEHQHNEAMVDLGVAMSLRLNATNAGEHIAGSEETTQHIKDLECRCAAAMAEHDALVDKGPLNEHDDVFGMKVSELMHRYDQLSMEVTQAKEELEQRQQSHAGPVPAFSPGTSATCEDQNENHGFLGLTFASSLTRILFKPFTSRKSASHSGLASSSSKSDAGNASSRDGLVSSNHVTAWIEVDENVELILPSLNAATAEIAISDLAAIGTIGVEEVIALPLDLHYPSDRIRHQVLVLRTNLEIARLESERALEEYYGSLRQQLQSRVESLEDELVTLHREVVCAQATAEEEERLRQERIARRAAAELRRKRLEEERAAEAERLRHEQERLEAARRKQEEATRQSLQGLDLRRCGNCGYGPFEKTDCNNMADHNDEFTYIDSNGRRQKRRRNECPQCKWTHPNWKAWPEFDAKA